MDRNEALKIVKNWELIGENMEALSVLIPELKENKDEEIKELLIDYFKEHKKRQGEFGANSFWGIPTDDIIAWLERRSEQVFTNSTKTFKNEDERIRNFIANELACIRATDEKGSDRYEELTKAIDWLEKQGEQNLANSGKTCKDEQKSVDKVEAKFNIGDWIVHNTTGFIFKVESSGYGGYSVVNTDGFARFISFDREGMYHLWSIQDAKDGDVLATENKNIFIFKSISGQTVYDYCGWYFEKFVETSGAVNGSAASILPADYAPATKEQRDLLLKKMEEAGYTFDFEKKELKRI